MNKLVFLLLLFGFQVFSQGDLPNDCENAIVVCGNDNFISNASGIGDTQEVSGCSGSEHNSLWLKINIVQTGTLGFNLIPSDPSIMVDYDFWVYAANAVCGSLGSPIRCCTTNPNLAGLSSNVTGMIGTTITATSGPGANGNGFVRWLNVVAGQSYYIAIDRPEGDGGFEIQWTGTATFGTGAFPIPPTANAIASYQTCSNSSQGIFDLNTRRELINLDTTNHEITFYETAANAIDGVDSLTDVIGTISQTIYARVKNIVTECFTITSFNLVVNQIPVATMSLSDATICEGENVTVSFNGTPGATIEYSIGSGTTQTDVLDSLGNFSFIDAPNSTIAYNLISVKSTDTFGTVICSRTYTNSLPVTVTPLPVLTATPTATSICSGQSAVIDLSSDIIGTTYAWTVIENGVTGASAGSGSGSPFAINQALTASGTIDGTVTYRITPTYNTCDGAYVDVTITVNPLPTASILGTATVCSGVSTDITFTGTPNASVVYKINNGLDQTILLDTTGTAILPVTLTNTATYSLVSVTSSVAPFCNKLLSASAPAVVTVIPIPTVAITGSTTICSGSSTPIKFEGTPNAVVTYNIDGGSNQTLTLDAITGKKELNPVLLTTTVYNLVSVTLGCTQLFSNSVTITVNPLPTVQIQTSNTSICSGGSATISFNGTPNSLVTFTTNGSSPETITLGNNGLFSITKTNITTTSSYDLVSVTSSGMPACTKLISGSMTVTVKSMATVVINATQTAICSNYQTSIALSSLDTTTTFSWTVVQNGVTGAQAGNGTLISQTLVTTSSLVSGTATYKIIPDNGCEGTPVYVTITVNPSPTVVANSFVSICSEETTNILLGTTIPGTTFTWTVVQNGVTGASDGSAVSIGQTLSTTSNAIGTAVYSIIPKANNCIGFPFSITVEVNPSPSLTLEDGIVCLDDITGNPINSHTFYTGLNNTIYNFEWFYNGNLIPLQTQSSVTVNQLGTYSVIATNTVTGCFSDTITANLVGSTPGKSLLINHSSAFSDNPFVEINVIGGDGNYQYQLDNGFFQTSPLFYGIIPGEHEVRVIDSLSCTNLTGTFTTIGFIPFFTPNGDGYNDTWNINGLENNPKSNINIFDRYGKLIKNIKPNSTGWDGTFNGQQLLSTDYWFTIDYVENGESKVFKSHFSLKR
jgi:gliding motility-associated-like protein